MSSAEQKCVFDIIEYDAVQNKSIYSQNCDKQNFYYPPKMF